MPIASGELDPHLVAIGDAIHARRELLRTVAAATALAQLCVGDDVMFNHKVRPRYLTREGATVVEIDDRSVAVAARRSLPRRPRAVPAARSAQAPRRTA
jgi:hypothetical protein